MDVELILHEKQRPGHRYGIVRVRAHNKYPVLGRWRSSDSFGIRNADYANRYCDNTDFLHCSNLLL